MKKTDVLGVIIVIALLAFLTTFLKAQDTLELRQPEWDLLQLVEDTSQQAQWGFRLADSLPDPVYVVRNFTYSVPSFDCVRKCSETAWEEEQPGSECGVHEWISAEYSDLNDFSYLTKTVYCPCGCPTSTVEGRICSLCGRMERRVVTCWYEQEARESLYKRFKEKFHGSNN